VGLSLAFIFPLPFGDSATSVTSDNGTLKVNRSGSLLRQLRQSTFDEIPRLVFPCGEMQVVVTAAIGRNRQNSGSASFVARQVEIKTAVPN